MGKIQTGSDNILIGRTATQASTNTAISRNIIITPLTVADYATISDTVAISPWGALSSASLSSTATYNTALGDSNLGGITDGSQNTAAGSGALKYFGRKQQHGYRLSNHGPSYIGHSEYCYRL